MIEHMENAGAIVTNGWVLIPTFLLLLGAVGGAGYLIGLGVGDRRRARRYVLNTCEDEVAETITLPTQREPTR